MYTHLFIYYAAVKRKGLGMSSANNCDASSKSNPIFEHGRMSQPGASHLRRSCHNPHEPKLRISKGKNKCRVSPEKRNLILDFENVVETCNSDSSDSDVGIDDMYHDDLDGVILNQNLWRGYMDLGPPSKLCNKCCATMWNEERNNKSCSRKEPTFSMCCRNGQIHLPKERPPPEPLASLLLGGDKLRHFKQYIRVYNCMFQFTSTGNKIDNSINRGSSPYCFRLQGQNYHLDGSLVPLDGSCPKFFQLYIYDTQNEVKNIINAVGGASNNVDLDIIEELLSMLDKNNELVKAFRMARNRGRPNHITPSDEVAAFIVSDDTDTGGFRDTVVNSKQEGLKRIYETNPHFMQLQYPLLFPWGTEGYHKRIPLISNKYSETENLDDEELDPDSTQRQHISPREYYCYKIMIRTSEVMHVIKFQKRGFPHVHMLIWLSPESIPNSVEKVDQLVSAEIPDKNSDPIAYEAVKNYMMHGPCDLMVIPILTIVVFLFIGGVTLVELSTKKGSTFTINICKGALSFTQLRTIDGTTYDTFKEACGALGLLNNDKQWHDTLEENAFSAMPTQIRAIFVNILANCSVSDPLALWQKHWPTLSDDVLYMRRTISDNIHLTLSEYEIQNYALAEIEKLLNDFGSGITATLLPGGRTAHSRFKIPLKLDQSSIAGIKHGTYIAELMQHTSLIIWDKLQCSIAMHLKPLTEILPILPKAGRAEIMNASFNKSRLWNSCEVFLLSQNMRLHSGNSDARNKVIADFSKWQLYIGDGKVECIDTQRADVETEFILERVSGNVHTYLSQDSVEDRGVDDNDFDSSFPIEYLNSINMPCMPKHELKVKVGVAVMLMRNLNQILGLCNGTRMIVTGCKKNSLECQILCGSQVGFAMTVNKSQGQSWDIVGLYLLQPVFSHEMEALMFEHILSLDKSRSNWKIKARVTRMWPTVSSESQITKGWNLSHFYYDNTHIHAFAFTDTWKLIGKNVVEGAVYIIETCTVRDASGNLKPVSTDTSIRFTNATTFQPCTDYVMIPKYKFEFMDLGDLMDEAKKYGPKENP
ncbi:uncharacterized protein LOC141660953 [Apium graveolens]|uniref:uncharacterized protein LOC141660953 n=1 Tax=Apium graveolens TaxID=4045 RepID=UPI003D7B74C0